MRAMPMAIKALSRSVTRRSPPRRSGQVHHPRRLPAVSSEQAASPAHFLSIQWSRARCPHKPPGVLRQNGTKHVLGKRQSLQEVVELGPVIVAAEEQAVAVACQERGGMGGVATEGGEGGAGGEVGIEVR